MTTKPTRVAIVTGAIGFIGFNLIHALFRNRRVDHVVAIDNAKPERWACMKRHMQKSFAERIHVVEGDIRRRELLSDLFDRYLPQSVYHLAAESHVDRSIDGPFDFLQVNVEGTFRMLQAAQRYYSIHHSDAASGFRFVNVSTDEVYGSITKPERASETYPTNPSSPYAASKAAADAFCLSYHKTYGLPVLITRCCNNYGPWQMPEKLVPLMTIKAQNKQALPIYGKGTQVREWIHVSDHCEALMAVKTRGVVGEIYNIGTGEQVPNKRIVSMIRDLVHVDQEEPLELKEVDDRPGHDKRYALDCSKIRQFWKPTIKLKEGLEDTVDWYLEHGIWSKTIEDLGEYTTQRVGTNTKG